MSATLTIGGIAFQEGQEVRTPRGPGVIMGCSYTEPLLEAIVLRRQGQPDMFEERAE